MKRLRAILLGALMCMGVAHAETSVRTGPEVQLLNIYRLISDGQSDSALQAANILVEQFPSFNLGHLIRGDILLSRTRPLTTLGDTHKPEQYDEKLSDLRDEAKGRLRALTTPPPSGALPDALIKLSQEQKYALVVDASKSRLYVFSNQQGHPQFVTDFYVSIGKAGSDKQSTGDQKTPLGVYRITSSIPGNKLTDFYGKGALTLNYPNTWDQQRGRTGYGIWLHGVPSAAYNRPPKASNGCVVLANPDMETLLNTIQPGTTVVIADKIRWLSPQTWKIEQSRLLSRFSSQHIAAMGDDPNTSPNISIFRYPAQRDMVQINVRTKAGKESGRDQYWAFDGNTWHMVQKNSSS